MANDSILIQVQLGSPTKANVNAVTRQIQNSLSNVSANVQIQNGRQATQTLQTIKKGTDSASKSMASFGEAIGLSGRRFLAFTSAVAVVGRLTSALSQATREAIKFEREFVKLAQVFDTDVKALGSLQNSISALAQEFGLSATVIAKTSVVLAQAGLSARQTQQAMAALAKTTLAATFDSLASSTEGAVAIMSQFRTEASQLESQLGAINAVSKKFAVESGDIIEAVRRAGGAFRAAGGDLNDFIALFTAVRSTTRESAETIATGFRTIFARLQRPKVIDYFRELNIELTNGAGQFVGAYNAIRLLSDGLDKLGIKAGDIKFAEIVEQLGGIRQVSRVIPLLQEFARAERARQVAVDGAGSLDADAAKAQGTLAQAFARTTENFRALIREITQTGTFQAFVNIALSMANAFIEAARAIKPLIPLLAAMAAIKIGGLLGGALKKGFGGAGGTGGLGQGFNRGGLVPGTGNSDTVPAVLTPGEFVIRKSAVKAIGADRLAGINKYKKGGAVASVDLKKTIDGDSLGINFSPAEEPYYTSSRLVGADTFEMSEKPGTKNRFLAEEGKKVTDQWARSLSSKQLTDKFKKANKYDGFGRPMFEAPDLIKFLRANPATYRGKKTSLLTGRFEDKKMANGGPAGTDTVPALLTPGEFVINKKSAEAFGYNGLEKINKYASGGPVGVQRFNVGGSVGINRSELYLKQILDELRKMDSLGGGGGGGGGETDENIDTIKQESKERENLTSIVGESFAQQQKYSLALTASTAGLALFSGSLGPTFAPLTELLTKTTVNFGFFNAGLGAGQKAAAKIAGGFEKMGISNPADTFEKLKSKTQEAGNSIKEMFKSKGTKEEEKTGILDQIRKGGAAGSKADGAKPTGAKEEIIKSATIQIKQAEIKVDGQKGGGKEKFKMPALASRDTAAGALQGLDDALANLVEKQEDNISKASKKILSVDPQKAKLGKLRDPKQEKQRQIARMDAAGVKKGQSVKAAEAGKKSPIMDQLRKDLSGLGKDLRKVGTASRTVFMSLSRIPAVGPVLGAVGAAATAVAGGLGVAAKGALALGKAGVKGGAKLLKSTGKALTKGLGKTAKAAAGALGGIAEAGTSAVGLFASAMAAVASQEAETAAKRKEDAIKEGDIKATVAAFEQESAAQFRSAAITSGASAGAGIGTAIGALLIPVLGPLGPVIGGLIGSIGGLVAGLAVSEEFLTMIADAARTGASMFLSGINIIVQGINDYFLTPLSEAINYIYSWVTDEEIDINIEVPKVSGKVATALLNAIPDPALTKQLEKAQAIHAASLSKYTRTQEAANKAVEDSMKSFLVADDAATKISSLNDAIDSAASKLTGTEGIELVSKEDIAANKARLKKLRADQAAGSAAGGDGPMIDGSENAIRRQNAEIQNLIQTIQQNEEAYKAQQEAITQSTEHFAKIFEASRNAGFLAQTLAKANNQQKLAIDASGVITAASLKEGSALKASFEARVRADTSMRPIEEKQRSALLAMTQEIFGVNGALGEMKKATEKAYQTVGAELKTLAFGSEQERAGSAQKVLASAAVASGQVKINDLSDDAKKGALSFLPALANAGISDFGGGNIMESLTANVADAIPGFDQIGAQAAEDVRLQGGTEEQAAAAQKEEQDRLVKAMFGIDDTAMKQLQAAQDSLAVQREILAAQTGQKEESTVPADPKQGENGKAAADAAVGDALNKAAKGDIKAAAAASDGELKKDNGSPVTETPEQVQVSVLDEAKKQTVLLAAILAKPVAAGVAGAQGSLAKDVNAAYDTAKSAASTVSSAASTAISYTPLGVVRNTLGLGETTVAE